MLEIIGWMLCVYLFVKGCELFTMKRQEGAVETTVAYFAGVIVVFASFIFFLLVITQASSVHNSVPTM